MYKLQFEHCLICRYFTECYSNTLYPAFLDPACADGPVPNKKEDNNE